MTALRKKPKTCRARTKGLRDGNNNGPKNALIDASHDGINCKDQPVDKCLVLTYLLEYLQDSWAH